MMSTSKKKILIIINPISGVGRQMKVEKLAHKYLDKNILDYSFAYSQWAGHTIEIAKKAVEDQFDIVVAVGGDGSINEVVSSIVNTKVALAIIPTGSGNGLAHHLGIHLNLAKALKTINKLHCIAIDTAVIQEKIFASVAGIGYDAKIAHRFSQSKHRGFFPYLRLVFSVYFEYQPINYTFSFDGKVIQSKALFVTFSNSNQFGYNIKISPQASLQDGLIDVCIVEKFPLSYALKLIYLVIRGKSDRSKYLKIYRTSQVEVSSECPEMIHIDGDPLHSASHIYVKILPKSLQVIVP